MRIAIGSLQQESNTFCPVNTVKADFDQAYGWDMLEKLNISDILEEVGAEVVPTLYAHALPGGAVVKEDFLELVEGIVSALPVDDLDGIWLYLHGAMYVSEIGSGETYLLKCIRDKVGYDIPIALAMDFHANNTEEIFDLANVICGFRTAPHIDKVETERKALRCLIECIEKKLLPKPQAARAYVMVPGDAMQTALPPLKQIMATADEMEKQPGLLCAQVFGGQSWVDTPFTGPSMVVTHKSDTRKAKEMAETLARHFYDVRHDFKFLIEAVEPDEAIRLAMAAEERIVFISDSGDNTTAGATGDNAFMLNRLIEHGAKNVLLAGIADKKACDKCYAANIGDELTLTIGGSLDKTSEKANIKARLAHRSDVLGYTGDWVGRAAVLDMGGITVILTERRTAFTGEEIFKSVNINILDYRIVVVKLGYLFPDLARIADRAILAFSPGSSPERPEDMGLKRIHRPMFPFDDDFID
jgi:microcystin degradation protein MlrC